MLCNWLQCNHGSNSPQAPVVEECPSVIKEEYDSAADAKNAAVAAWAQAGEPQASEIGEVIEIPGKVERGFRMRISFGRG